MRILCALFVLILASTTCGAGHARAEEPQDGKFGGHDATFWVKQLGDNQRRAAARAALAALGDAAVLPLGKAWMATDDRSLRSRVVSVLRRGRKDFTPLIPMLRKVLKSADDPRFSDALQIMRAMGPQAAPLVDALVPHMHIQSGGRSLDPLKVVARIGAGAKGVGPAIIAAALQRDDLDRLPALEALLKVLPDAPETEGLAIGLLGDEDSRMRESAMRLLRDSKVEPVKKADWILPRVRDPVPRIRRDAVVALGQLKKEHAIWSEAVIEAARDSSARVRSAAMSVIYGNADVAEQAVPEIVAFAERANRDELRHLLGALVRLRMRTVEAVPAVLEIAQRRGLSTPAINSLRPILAAESGAWAAKQIRTAPPEALAWIAQPSGLLRDVQPTDPVGKNTWLEALRDRLKKGDLPTNIASGLVQRFAHIAGVSEAGHTSLLDLMLVVDGSLRPLIVNMLRNSTWRDNILAKRWHDATDDEARVYIELSKNMMFAARARTHRASPGASPVDKIMPVWLGAKSAVLREHAMDICFGLTQPGLVLAPPPAKFHPMMREHLRKRMDELGPQKLESILGSDTTKKLLGDQWGLAMLDLMDRTKSDMVDRRIGLRLGWMLASSTNDKAIDVLTQRVNGDDDERAVRAARALSWMASAGHREHHKDPPYLDLLIKRVRGLLASEDPQTRWRAAEAAAAMGPLADPMEQELFSFVDKHDGERGRCALGTLLAVFPDRGDVRKRVIARWRQRDLPGWTEVPMILIAQKPWGERATIDLLEKPEEDGHEHWWAVIGNVIHERAYLKEKFEGWLKELPADAPRAKTIRAHMQHLR